MQTGTTHEHTWVFVQRVEYEDEELYRLSKGKHGGPFDEYKCTICPARTAR